MDLMTIDNGVTLTEKNDLEQYITDTVEALKLNQTDMNKFVMQSISALSASEARSKELASQGFFGRLWGSITGKNRKLQNSINLGHSKAIYAVTQAVKRLAEQNAMSFELITAVNNKLNNAVLEINDDINELKKNLIVLFKQSRNEIAQINQRIDVIEKNVALERWHDTVEYFTFNGCSYDELGNIEAVICLTNDFYVKTQGTWTFSDLMLLKATFKEIGINVKDKISYKELSDAVSKNPMLREKLFEGISINNSQVDYVPAYALLEKKRVLENEEKYICETVAKLSGASDTNAIVNNLVDSYSQNNIGVNYNAEINVFDLSLELLAGLKGYEWTEPSEDSEIIDVEPEEEVLEEVLPKVDWSKYPFPQYRRVAISSLSTIAIDNDGKVYAWGNNQLINTNIPQIDEPCVSVSIIEIPDINHNIKGTYNGRQSDVKRIDIALAMGVSSKLYYWGDFPNEIEVILKNICSVKYLSESGFPIVSTDGYATDIRIDFKDGGKAYIKEKQINLNVKILEGFNRDFYIDYQSYAGVTSNNRFLNYNVDKGGIKSSNKGFDDNTFINYVYTDSRSAVAVSDNLIYFWGDYDKGIYSSGRGTYYHGSAPLSNNIYARCVTDSSGYILCLDKKQKTSVIKIVDYCNNFADSYTGEIAGEDYTDHERYANFSTSIIGEIIGAWKSIDYVKSASFSATTSKN